MFMQFYVSWIAKLVFTTLFKSLSNLYTSFVMKSSATRGELEREEGEERDIDRGREKRGRER